MALTIKTIFKAIDQMTAPISTMQKKVGKFATSARHASDSLSAGFGKLRGVITMALGGLSVMGAARAMDSFAARGDDIADVAKRLGITAEALQELQFAAKMADLSAEDLASNVQRMNKNLGEMRARTGALYSYLSKANPALALQLNTVRDSDEAFSMLMEAIARETDVQKRAALAQAAFGRSGQALIDMADGLAEKRKQARAAGAIISNEDVEAARKMHENILRLKTSGMSLVNQVLGRIAVKLIPIVERWLAWIEANRELVGQRIASVIDGIGAAFRFLAPFAKVFFEILGWAQQKNILKWLAIGLGAATIAMWALNVAMDANPVGAIILALEALVLIIIVVKRYWKEITDFLMRSWNKVNEVFNMPGVRIALSLISQPLLIILGIIQTIIDLVQGKGAKALLNLMGPIKGFTDLLGITKGGGEVIVSPNAGPARAAAASAPGNWQGRLEISGAPPGSKYSGSGTAAPAITIKTGSAFARGYTQ